jgi:hypothetical protein
MIADARCVNEIRLEKRTDFKHSATEIKSVSDKFAAAINNKVNLE